jgi:hypothetical protein
MVAPINSDVAVERFDHVEQRTIWRAVSDVGELASWQVAPILRRFDTWRMNFGVSQIIFKMAADLT